MAITLIPAYGRKYKTKGDLLDDWYAGKDFKVLCGPYTSIKDYWALSKQYGIVLLQHREKSFEAPPPRNDPA